MTEAPGVARVTCSQMCTLTLTLTLMSSLLLTSAGAGPGYRGLAVRAGAGEGGADGGDLVAVQDQVPGLLPRQDVVNLVERQCHHCDDHNQYHRYRDDAVRAGAPGVVDDGGV